MDRVERVLIVGGGLAGLALAIALRQRGLSPALIERATSWGATGTGLYLIGSATRALRLLGLAEEVTRRWSLIRAQTLLNHRGARVAEVDTEAFWRQCGPCLGTLRGDLHSALAHKIDAQRIRFGLTVRTLLQNESQVTVQLSDGATEEYDLVVGADGIRSTIRRLAFDNSEPRFRGQVGWRFVGRLPPGINGWTAFLGRGTAFLIVPISNDHAYFYADTATAQLIQDPPERRLERLRHTFREFAGPVREVLTQIESAKHVHFSAIEEVAPRRYGRGRIVLIGDAAHAMSPNMACGVAMAFEDALVLADIIARAGAGSDIVPAFIDHRSARIEWVHAQTDRRDRMRNMSPAIRDVLLRLLWGRLYRANYQPLLTAP
jgi:2-polyprenyl-6-methoxyphenol hydroxylase-like FAD-dependent oxidoreductase